MLNRTEEIIDVLRFGGATEDLPMTAAQLALILDLDVNDPSHRSTRRAVLRAVKDGARIGSNGQGYFLLKNKKQCQKYLNSLMTQMVRLSERIALVHESMQG